jgi:hypothetical protein
MLPKTLFLGGIAGIAALVACTGDDSAKGVDPRYSFIPGDAPRACARDEDCVAVGSIRNCTSCCPSDVVVARGEGERARAAILEACRDSDAPKSNGTCITMGCGGGRPACFDRTCVMLSDFNTHATIPACMTRVDPADAGAPAPDPGAGPSCGARAVRTGFEDGLDPSWTVTDPTAFQIDRERALAGAASLRIGYRQKNAYLTIAQPDACGVRIAFTLRTHFIEGGVTLARIVVGEGAWAGKGWWFHIRLDGCRLSVEEEARSGSGLSMGGGGASVSVPDDFLVRVVLTLDLRANTMTLAGGPVGQPHPPPQTTPLRGHRAPTEGVRAIELGSAPGYGSTGVGNVWLDDLVIE